MTSTPEAASAEQDCPIAIVGSGFGGIGMAIRLRQAGIHSFTIYERASEIGGTWRDNTYPGAACDVPSHVYSFSFEPNPEWSRRYAPSAEIQAYLLRCVERHDIRRHIRFDTEIVGASFDADQGRWTLTTRTGETVAARLVVSAVGGLVDPAYPEIPGIADFAGTTFHTARWNHDYDLAGKRVAVIGTGASAIQVVPSIADRVESLAVFQRTPSWIMPKADRAIPAWAKRLFRRVPAVQKLVRGLLYALSEARGPLVFLDAPRLSKLPEAAARAHLRKSVKDPELRRKLTPSYQFGCKRVLISDDYLPTFERDNVELVTEGILRITPAGIRTRDGREHPFDAIIFATGFAVGLARAAFPVTGLGGQTLDEAWRDGAVAYKGMCVAGFPNWFMIMGPNTGPGHTSVLVYTEAQIAYVLQAVHLLREPHVRWLTVKQSVQDAYNAGIQGRMTHMVWQSGCNSWYLDSEGENHALYPGFATEYCLRVRRLHPSEFDIARTA